MIEIRSYRNVFDLERRIYRIDRLRLNPNGIPLRGIIYFLALLAVALIAEALPLIGLLLGVLPWYLCDIALPGVGAALLTLIQIEGRPFHLAALALLRYSIAPRQLAGVRPRVSSDRCWRFDELIMLVDGSDARMRSLLYRGPGAVLVNAAHVRIAWPFNPLRQLVRRPDLRLVPLHGKPRPAQGQVIELPKGVRLRVEG